LRRNSRRAPPWTKGRPARSEDALLTATEPHITNAAGVQRHYFVSRTGFDASRADPERYRLITPADFYGPRE
jgi:hypothetical protein